MDEDDECMALRQFLEQRCPGAKFKDGDIKKLVDAGYDTETALAAASKDSLDRILPTRPGVVHVLVKAFVQPAGNAVKHEDVTPWPQRLESLVEDDEMKGRILLKLSEKTPEFLSHLFSSSKDDVVRAALLALIEPAAATGFKFRAEDVIGGESDGINGRRNSYFTARSETVIGICKLVHKKGALLIRAPPGSGKTSILQLVAAAAKNFQDMFKQVYYVSLAQIGTKSFDDFLEEKHPGVRISELQSPKSSPDRHPKSGSESRPSLLLVDEGQVAFDRDLTLWATAKDCASGSGKHLRIIIVSAWGSTIVSRDGQRFATPVKFNSDASIGLLQSAKNPISLTLTRDEAIDLWNSWCYKGLDFRDGLASWDDLRDYVFDLTGQQPGLMAHVLDFLIAQGLKNSEAGSMEQKEKARDLLLSRQFYDSLSQIRSLLAIGKALRGEKPDGESMRSLLRKLLPAKGVCLGDFSGRDLGAADLAIKWGQIQEENGTLSLPSELHRRFLLREVYCTNESTSDSIEKNGLHAFIDRVIERFNPRQLKSSKARNASETVVYESQYQNEFYRAACSILPAASIMSPNVGPLFGAKGYLDYYLLPHRWGFELLVDGSELKEHQARFGPGGVYHKLIQDGVVSKHAILDFRTKRLVEAKPDVLHIVFSEDFEKATLHRSGSSPREVMLRQ